MRYLSVSTKCEDTLHLPELRKKEKKIQARRRKLFTIIDIYKYEKITSHYFSHQHIQQKLHIFNLLSILKDSRSQNYMAALLAGNTIQISFKVHFAVSMHQTINTNLIRWDDFDWNAFDASVTSKWILKMKNLVK